MQSTTADRRHPPPPLLAGRGPPESVFHRFLATESAGALTIDPVMDHVERGMQRINRLVLELAARKGTGDGKLFPGLVYRARKSGKGYSVLDPADILKNGTRNIVRYKRTNEQQLVVKSNRLLQELQAKVIDLDTVRKELGYESPEDLEQGIFRDAANQDPNVVKAKIMEALGRHNPVLYSLWQWSRNMEAQAQQGPPGGGPPGGRPGLPSPPRPPGPPGPPGRTPMPGAPSPNAAAPQPIRNPMQNI